jgi:hypothetical protein
VHQQDALSSDLNNRIAGVSASFGTAQQQHDKMAALQALGGIQDDRLAALGQIQKVQAGQQQLAEHQRFLAGADIMGQQLLGLKPGQGGWLADSGQLPEIMQTHFRAMEPTEAVRTYTQTRQVMKNQGMSDSQIDALMPPQSVMLGPNASLEDHQYLQYAWGQQAQGKTPVDIDTWKAQHQAAGTAMVTQAKDVQDFKDSATQDYTNLNTTYTKSRALVDQLLKNPDATMAALKYPEFMTTGKIGAMSPVEQDVKNQALALNQLRASLTGASLQNVKNVRNQREFATLGQAATAGLDAANSPQGLQSALQDIKNKFLDAQATSEMAVGHKLTGDLVGRGNRDLLNPSNPYYNGATEESLRTPTESEMAQTKAYLAEHPEQRGPLLEHMRSQGVSTEGL